MHLNLRTGLFGRRPRGMSLLYSRLRSVGITSAPDLTDSPGRLLSQTLTFAVSVDAFNLSGCVGEGLWRLVAVGASVSGVGRRRICWRFFYFCLYDGDSPVSMANCLVGVEVCELAVVVGKQANAWSRRTCRSYGTSTSSRHDYSLAKSFLIYVQSQHHAGKLLRTAICERPLCRRPGAIHCTRQAELEVSAPVLSTHILSSRADSVEIECI